MKMSDQIVRLLSALLNYIIVLFNKILQTFMRNIFVYFIQKCILLCNETVLKILF